MSGNNIISADRIEEMKENIQPISKGYKTSSLERVAEKSSSNQTNHKIERERRIKYEALVSNQSLIDDLTPFMEYLAWTREHYPSGHSSITKITEDAIRRFRKDERYKNDFRYVELWMALGKKQQDAGDLFKYLIVNGIGTQCALFYEEYAGYKESMGCLDQADEIYRKGISKKAVPLSRLVRQYDAFLVRREESSPSNEALPKIAGILKERDLPEFDDEEEENHPAPQRRFSIALPAIPKAKKTGPPPKSKLRVFKDSADQDLEDSLFPAPPSKKAIDTAEYDLKPVPKENATQAESWTGSVLNQHPVKPISLPPKMNVFRDEDDDVAAEQDSRSSKKQKKTMLQPSLKSHIASTMASVLADPDKTQPGPIAPGAKIRAHLEMCYQGNLEYSFEENRADLCHMDELNHTFTLADVTVLVKPSFTQATPRKSEHMQNREGPSPWHTASNAPGAVGESRLSSPGKEKGEGPIKDIFKMFDEDKLTKKSSVPSPTIHTKEAMSAINAMFGSASSAHDEDVFGDGQERRGMEITTTEDAIIYNPEDDETISRQVYKRPESSVPLKIGVFKDEDSDDDDIPPPPDLQTPFQSRPVTNLFGQPVHVMTPVTECSEKNNSYTSHSISTGPSLILNRPPVILEEEEERTENTMLFLKSKSDVHSATKLDLVEEEIEEADSYEEPSLTLPNPCNPTLVRQAILSKTQPPSDCRLFVLASVQSQLGAAISKSALDGSLLSFTKNEKFRLVNRLGTSNYYVAERESGERSVVRLQDPPSVWEFYMLFSLHSKISEAFKDSFVKPISCYLFKNESFTELEYIEGGSLLEAIGHLNYSGPGIPEIVAAFWTLKLITILEELHSRRIIHGDIQINNLMVSGKGSNPRKKYDLILNDFSAAIDMSDCPDSHTFKIESSSAPATDDFMEDELTSSECWEFRSNSEWTFEPDWFGAAGVIHMLIFGEPMSITESSTGIASHSTSRKPFIDIRSSLPVHFGEMWIHAFTTLLNLSHKELNTSSSGSPLESLKVEFQVFVSKHDHLLDDAFARCNFA